jgi:hypothetical protein
MLKDLLCGLREVLAFFQKEREARNERHEKALLARYAAVNETRLYLKRATTGEMDRKTEEELSRMWTRAAVAVRRIDAKLADRCLKKSDYWVSPENWADQEVISLGIGIDEIFEESRRLLKD